MFLPVVAEGYYLQNLPDLLNGLPATGNSSAISTAPYSIDRGTAIFLSVGENDNSELYGSTPGSLARIQTLTPTSVALTSDHQWSRNSPAQRFFFTDNANAFCIEAGELRYYDNLSPSISQVNLNGNYDLLASSIESSTTFYDISSSTDACTSCVTLSLDFTESDVRLRSIKTISSDYVLP